MAFGIFFMRQNIVSIPDELMDAARIDGCSSFASTGRLSCHSVSRLWPPYPYSLSRMPGDFIWPLLITNDVYLYTMELGLGMFQHRFTVDYGSITAASVISIVPIITVFVISADTSLRALL